MHVSRINIRGRSGQIEPGIVTITKAPWLVPNNALCSRPFTDKALHKLDSLISNRKHDHSGLTVTVQLATFIARQTNVMKWLTLQLPQCRSFMFYPIFLPRNETTTGGPPKLIADRNGCVRIPTLVRVSNIQFGLPALAVNAAVLGEFE